MNKILEQLSSCVEFKNFPTDENKNDINKKCKRLKQIDALEIFFTIIFSISMCFAMFHVLFFVLHFFLKLVHFDGLELLSIFKMFVFTLIIFLISIAIMAVIDTIKNKKYSVELKCGGVEFYENKCKNICKILELTDLLKDKNIYHLKFIIQNNKYEEDSKNSAELIITSIDNDGTLYKQNILFYYYDILENIKITKPQFDFENLTLIIPTLNQNINANGLIYNLNFKHNKEKDNYTWECFVKQINN